MQVLEFVGICFVALLALLFAIFFRRRLLMVGGGTIRLQVRVSTLPARAPSTTPASPPPSGRSDPGPAST